ncbi:MAG TPA: tRNA uridine-5-carboxymethylaminomethyl(34) synthesis GTPase MnmE [Candidatus Limnocylindrales bacterium]|nr:tRNA uridine-5-carboxymethylaminomethyl(34) synthesis GTPase MnmE [Candidatus Limnocylindrales bacterium]
MNLDDTIVAIATPPGRGGIGVVRLAGAESRAIAAAMLRLKHELQPGRALFGDLVEPESGERIDEVVVTWFAKPHSYTADDVVEISAHGSPVVLRHILELAMARGARLAQPGEFTMRAFLNGRIDLTQAEAVNDLIESQTLYQAKVAAQQLEGVLSRRLQPIKKRLVDLIAVMEAGIDFAEDDVAVISGDEIRQRINAIQQPLEQLLESFAYGKIVHEGLTLAIVGRPNVGKSSLFNRLVERERAIVTATPGTTRDLVTETVSLGGIPLKLVDTAGIRQAKDEAESIGIRKSYEALSEADMVLVVLDSTQDLSAEDHLVLEACKGRRALAVANKADLDGARRFDLEGFEIFRTSALTGQGIDGVREEILRQISGHSRGEQETGFLTNVRHKRLVEECITSLDAARQATMRRIPHEMIMLDLYGALRPLDAITGETTTDDILNLIFSSFCIGK